MFIKRLPFIVAAIVLGFLSSRFVVGWYTTIPWVIATPIVGYLSKTRRDSLINGGLFGYVLFLVYTSSVYRGKTDTKSILLFIGFTLVFSLVGAIAGVVGGFIGNWVKGVVKGKG
jgi:cytochrome c biogenesis protein CcdA